MRIGISAIHVNAGNSGSHEPYLTNLVSSISLLDIDFEIMVFCTRETSKLFKLDDSRKIVFRLYPSSIKFPVLRILFEQFVLPFEVWRLDIHAMHYAGTASSIFARKCDVVTIHHDPVTQQKSMSFLHILYYKIVMYFNRRLGIIVSPTEAYSKLLIEHFNYEPAKLRSLHHGVDQTFRSVSIDEKVAAQIKWSISDNSIISITNSKSHKNLGTLVAAFDKYVKRYDPTLQLVLVGAIDKKILQELINKRATDPKTVRANIVLIPFIPHKQLPPIYSLAKALIFISTIETFGLPIVEAMACGLPVIASDIPVHIEVLGNNTKLVVPANNPELIATKLNYLLANTASQLENRNSSLLRSADFSWEKTAMGMLRIYKEAVQIGNHNRDWHVKSKL